MSGMNDGQNEAMPDTSGLFAQVMKNRASPVNHAFIDATSWFYQTPPAEATGPAQAVGAFRQGIERVARGSFQGAHGESAAQMCQIFDQLIRERKIGLFLSPDPKTVAVTYGYFGIPTRDGEIAENMAVIVLPRDFAAIGANIVDMQYAELLMHMLTVHEENKIDPERIKAQDVFEGTTIGALVSGEKVWKMEPRFAGIAPEQA